MLSDNEMPVKTPADLMQVDPPLPPRDTLPTMYDLPSEDPEEPGLPDVFHYLQPPLLQETFLSAGLSARAVLRGRGSESLLRCPPPAVAQASGLVAVLGVTQLYEQRDLRLSYVVWQEGAMPYIVVELLSPGTKQDDLGKTPRAAEQPPSKWEVYEQILRIPYYVTYDRYTGELRIFRAVEKPLSATTAPRPAAVVPRAETASRFVERRLSEPGASMAALV